MLLILLFISLQEHAMATKTAKVDPLPNPCEKEEKEPLPSSTKAIGGKLLTGNPEKHRFRIDGPANLRDAPKGKIINSFEKDLVVLGEGQKADWYLVRGYWDRVCESGWTHKSNLKPYVF